MTVRDAKYAHKSRSIVFIIALHNTTIRAKSRKSNDAPRYEFGLPISTTTNARGSTGRPQATGCVRKEIKSEKWKGPSPLYRPYLNQGSGGPPKGEAFRDIERLAVYNVKLAFGIDVEASWIARAFSKHSSRKQGYRGKSPIPATDLKILC